MTTQPHNRIISIRASEPFAHEPAVRFVAVRFAAIFLLPGGGVRQEKCWRSMNTLASDELRKVMPGSRDRLLSLYRSNFSDEHTVADVIREIRQGTYLDSVVTGRVFTNHRWISRL